MIKKYKRIFEASSFDSIEGVYSLLNSSQGLRWLSDVLDVDPDPRELSHHLKLMSDSEIRMYFDMAKRDGLLDRDHSEFKNYTSMR